MISAIQAEEMSMSIWLRSGGLSFAIYAQVSSDDASVVQEGYLPFVQQYTLRENIEHCLYQQAELGLPYARVHIYYYPDTIALVPEALYEDAEGDAWELTLCKHGERLRPYRLQGEDKLLLGSMPSDAVQLLERSFLVPNLCPIYGKALVELRQEAQQSLRPKLFVYLSPTGLTIAYISPEGLRYINSFGYVRPMDIDTHLGEAMYYLSLVWQTLSLDEAVDLRLEPENPETQNGFLQELEKAIRSVFH